MTAPVTMSSAPQFRDYDDPKVYEEIQAGLLDPTARNFVVEFGQNQARIALNVDCDTFKELLEDSSLPRSNDRPVRWM